MDATTDMNLVRGSIIKTVDVPEDMTRYNYCWRFRHRYTVLRFSKNLPVNSIGYQESGPGGHASAAASTLIKGYQAHTAQLSPSLSSST